MLPGRLSIEFGTLPSMRDKMSSYVPCSAMAVHLRSKVAENRMHREAGDGFIPMDDHFKVRNFEYPVILKQSLGNSPLKLGPNITRRSSD
ncbi:hypothetical protein D3C73_1516960 [compost metagenome]